MIIFEYKTILFKILFGGNMNPKKFFLLIFCLLIFTSCYQGKDIQLPDKNENYIIQIEYGDFYKVCTDPKEINEVLDIFSNAKNTNIESINDFPHKANDLITINLIMNERTDTYYFYEQNSKYYIERPYNGIWKLEEEKYNTLKNYFAQIEKAKIHDSKARNEFREFYSQNRNNEINGDKFKEFVELAFNLSYEDVLSLNLGKSYIIDNNVAYIGTGFSFGFDEENGELKLLSFNNKFNGAYIGKKLDELMKEFGEPTVKADYSFIYEIDNKSYNFSLGRKYYNKDIISLSFISK